MKIQFEDFIIKNGRKKPVNLSLNLEPLNFEGEVIDIFEPVKVEGEVYSQEGVVILNASIKTELKMHCSRCLDTFIYPIDIDIEERFTNNNELENEEVIFVEGDSLDIPLIVENSIISTLPIKRLCKEECKGLCTTCGKNMNIEKCNCDDYEVDIRLAKLKELFGNKEV